MAKKDQPFNNPFLGLKLAPKPTPAKQAPKPPRPPPAPAAPDEAELFRRHVGLVAPVRQGPRLADTPPPKVDASRVRTEEHEVLEQLASLVAGDAPFDLADSDEFVCGAIPGLDQRIVRALREGQYAVQDHLDLHGMVKADAKQALEAFILRAQKEGLRCVLVVHGRGLHSKDQIPVLKESLQLWLSRGRIGKAVLAFATARPHDGGAGAVYVLVRRR